MYQENKDIRNTAYYSNLLAINHQVYAGQGSKQNKLEDKKYQRGSFSLIAESQGFSEPISQKIDSFIKKDFEIPGFERFGFPENEKIKIFSVSIQDRIFRWKFDKQSIKIKIILIDQIEEYFLPKDGLKQRLNDRKEKIVNKIVDKIFKGQTVQQQDQNSKQIDKVYQDQHSNHCMLFDQQQNLYYLNFNSENIKRLKLDNYKLKSLAFDDREPNSEYIQFVVGTEDGEILLGSLQKKLEEYELTCKLVYKQSDKIKSIHHLRFLTFEQEQKNEDNKYHYLIIAGTNSGLFYFHQNFSTPLPMENIFKKINEQDNYNFLEVPQQPSHLSYVDVSYAKDSRRALSFAYSNGNGIINIKFPNKYQALDYRFLSNFEYLNCKKKESSDESEFQPIMSSMPVDILLTEHHYCILDQTSLTIYSMITNQIVEYYELKQQYHYFKLVHEKPHNFYICSEEQLMKVCYEDENVNIWKHYQEKKNLELAYQMCKEVNASETEYIAGLYADDLFNKGKYNEAVDVYSESNKSFEEIFLKLVQIDQQESRDALQHYLKLLMKQYDPEKDKIQIQILQAWLIELLVSQTKQALDSVRMTIIEDENHTKKLVDYSTDSIQQQKDQETVLIKKIQQITNNNQHEFDQNLVFQILQQHGMIDACLLYAYKKQNIEIILIHNINEQNYKVALNLIECLQINRQGEIMIKYCHIFFQNEPKMTENIFINKIKNFDPTKILGSLYNIDKNGQKYAINMLEYCINVLKSDEQSIHNSYIHFLAENKQIDHLEQYLQKQKNNIDNRQRIQFQFDFALKIFLKNQIYSSMIIIYGIMKLYSEAVNLALEQNMLSAAKDIAKNIGDILQQKKLYMQIVNHLLKNESQNIQEIVLLTQEAVTKDNDNILKIDEIIHRFDPNSEIKLFQGTICEQLQKYNNKIDNLKSEMENLSKSSERYERELISMNNNIIQFDTHKKCDYCKTFLLQNSYQFFLFPCHHGFHSICIIKIQTDFGMFQDKQIEDLKEVQQQIGKLRDEYQKIKQNDEEEEQQTNQNNNSKKISSQQQQRISQIYEQIDKLKKTYDKILGSECIQCCSQTVDSIIAPYQNNIDWNYNL